MRRKEDYKNFVEVESNHFEFRDGTENVKTLKGRRRLLPRTIISLRDSVYLDTMCI